MVRVEGSDNLVRNTDKVPSPKGTKFQSYGSVQMGLKLSGRNQSWIESATALEDCHETLRSQSYSSP